MSPSVLSILIAGVAGAIAGAGAYAVRKARSTSPVLPIVAAAVLFLAVNSIARRNVLSPYSSRYYREQAEREVLAIPLYQELRTHEPVLYNEILSGVIDAVQRGTSPAVLNATTRGRLAPLLPKYLPTASDDAVVAFARVVFQEISVLEKADPHLAFSYLFPQKHELLDLSVLPQDLRDQELACTAEIVRSGAAHQGAPPSEAVAKALLDQVASRMPPEALRHLAATAQPHADSVDKRGVVYASRVFYQQILALPIADAASLMRHLMKSAA